MKTFDLEELKEQILRFGKNAERFDISTDETGLTIKLKDHPAIGTTFTIDEAEDMTRGHKIDIGFLLSLVVIAYDAGKFAGKYGDAKNQYYFGEKK